MAAVADEARGMGRSARIGTVTILRGALDLVRRAGWRALVVWGVVGAASYAVQWVSLRLGVPIAAVGFTPAYVTYFLATCAVAGVSGAWSLRLFLDDGRRWLAFDRTFLQSAGLLAAMVLCLLPLTLLMELAGGLAADPDPEPGRALAGFAAVVGSLAALAGFAYATLRLMLWPVGRLMGRADVTPGRSWRLMRRATRGFVLAYGLMIIPVTLVIMAVYGGLSAALGRSLELMTPVLQFGTAGLTLVAYGMVATVYQLRVENPATVADVFD